MTFRTFSEVGICHEQRPIDQYSHRHLSITYLPISVIDSTYDITTPKLRSFQEYKDLNNSRRCFGP